MPAIYLRYAWDISKIYLSMPRIYMRSDITWNNALQCLIYDRDIPKIWVPKIYPIYMPDIWKLYTWNMSEICLRYTWYIPEFTLAIPKIYMILAEICPWCVKGMPEISLLCALDFGYALNIEYACEIADPDIPKIYPRYLGDIYDTSKRYSQDIP